MAYSASHSHRRHSKHTNCSSLFPSPSQLQKTLKHHQQKTWVIRERNASPNFTGPTWLVVPFYDEDNDEDTKLPSSIKLKEFACKFMAPRRNSKSLILVYGDPSHKDAHGIINKDPWASVVGRIRQALLGSFQNARSRLCMDGPVKNVPHMLFRFGKVLFHDKSSSPISFDNIDKSSALETALSQFHRSFFTSVPISFRETTVSEAIQKVGLDFDKEKDYYSVQVRDIRRPRNIMTCKCTVIQDVGGLEIHKVEMDEERHFVADISCLDKNLDLRLRLSSKRILTLTAGEKLRLTDFLKSAVINSGAKGRLRWPLGKKSVDGRYMIVQVCHSKTKLFRNSSMKLKLRRAERFDLKSKTGEVANEVSLRMTELNRMLRNLTLEVNPMVDVVRDAMKLIWDYFLCWEGSFT
ncbi:hypothetical protein ACHQM5_019330 [Ranunculus cassubicifolius]